MKAKCRSKGLAVRVQSSLVSLHPSEYKGTYIFVCQRERKEIWGLRGVNGEHTRLLQFPGNPRPCHHPSSRARIDRNSLWRAGRAVHGPVESLQLQQFKYHLGYLNPVSVIGA